MAAFAWWYSPWYNSRSHKAPSCSLRPLTNDSWENISQSLFSHCLSLMSQRSPFSSTLSIQDFSWSYTESISLPFFHAVSCHLSPYVTTSKICSTMSVFVGCLNTHRIFTLIALEEQVQILLGQCEILYNTPCSSHVCFEESRFVDIMTLVRQNSQVYPHKMCSVIIRSRPSRVCSHQESTQASDQFLFSLLGFWKIFV